MKFKMRKLLATAFGIVLLAFALAGWYYPQMPSSIITHWNIEGMPDGHMGKFWGLFSIPIVMLILFFMLVFIPTKDPLKKNVKEFQNYYDGFILLFMIFLFYLFMLMIVANMNIIFNFIYAIIPAFSLLFFYIGVLIENAKRNWFIGIRTPWTMSSDYVWKKTHDLGGNLIKVAAIITLFGVLGEKGAVWFILVPIVVSIIWLVLYSYYVAKENKRR